MAAPSRMMAKSSSAALGLFSKTMPALNRQLPLRALPAAESAVSRLINQPAAIIPTQLPLWTVRPRSAADEMLRARRPPSKVPDTEDDDEEVEDDIDIEMIDDEDDDEDDEFDDGEFDDEDEEFVKTKVRTRSHRDL